MATSLNQSVTDPFYLWLDLIMILIFTVKTLRNVVFAKPSWYGKFKNSFFATVTSKIEYELLCIY